MNKVLFFRNTIDEFKVQELYIQVVIDELVKRNVAIHLYDVKKRICYDFNRKNKKQYMKLPRYLDRSIINIIISFLSLIYFSLINKNRYDYTNFMYCRLEYLILAKYIFKISKINHVTIFGNMFVRKMALIKLYPFFFIKADLFLISTLDHAYYFINFMEKSLNTKFETRTKYMELPIPSLDIIKQMKDEYVNITLNAFQILSEELLICVGACASENEQHLKIIDELSKSKIYQIKKTTILFPLTYPINSKSKKYIDKIKISAKNKLHNYKIIYLEKYLQDEVFLALIKRMDIYINCKISDQLAAILCEALYSRTLVINGGWLKYELFINKNQLYALKINNFYELNLKIKYAIDNYKQIMPRLENNFVQLDKMYNNKLLLNKWCSLYTS